MEPNPNSKIRRSRFVLLAALLVFVLGGILLYDLVVSAKQSRELLHKPPPDRSRFLGQGEEARSPRAAPSGAPTSSAGAPAVPLGSAAGPGAPTTLAPDPKSR